MSRLLLDNDYERGSYLHYCGKVDREHWGARTYRKAQARRDAERAEYTRRFGAAMAVIATASAITTDEHLRDFIEENGPAILVHAVTLGLRVGSHQPWCDPLLIDDFRIVDPKVKRRHHRLIAPKYSVRAPADKPVNAADVLDYLRYPGWSIEVTCKRFDRVPEGWRGDICLSDLLTCIKNFHFNGYRRNVVKEDRFKAEFVFWEEEWPDMRLWDMLAAD